MGRVFQNDFWILLVLLLMSCVINWEKTTKNTTYTKLTLEDLKMESERSAELLEMAMKSDVDVGL